VQKNRIFVNLSIRTKLIVSFGLIFTCLVALIFSASVAIAELRAMQDEIYKEDIPTMSDLLLLSNNMNKLRPAVQMAILIDDATVKDREVSEISEITESTEHVIKELQSRFRQDAEAVEVLKHLHQQMQELEGDHYTEFVQQIRKKLSEDEKNQLLHDRRGLFRELTALSSSLNNLPERLATERRLEAESQQNQSLMVFTAFGGLALSVAFILVALMDRMIANPLLVLNKATKRIAEGDLDYPLAPHDDRKDEVGLLNRSFANMAHSLKERSDQLAQAIGNLQESNQELTQEVIERKRVEEVVRDSERRTRAILDTAPDGIITATEEGIIESVNEATLQMLGYFAYELVGKSITKIIPVFTAGTQLPGEAVAGESTDCFVQETSVKRKDGTIVPVEVAWSNIKLSDRRITTSVLRDITLRKEVEKRVSEFYSMVSHELRTPLTSIRGSLGLLEGKRAGELSPRAANLIKIARSESDRLIRLINDILDIRKIEAGKLDLKKVELEVGPLVESCIEAITGFAHVNGIEVIGEVETGLCVHADRDRINQVLTNLISNAIKFSPTGGLVKIQVDRTPDVVRFSIIDHGAGIPADQLHRLFGLFQQIDSSDSRPKSGTGLGLAISKAIVEEHNGKIGVDTDLGAGSTFWFELPLAVEARPMIEQAHATLSYRHTALLVEDDHELCKLLAVMLGEEGYLVVPISTIEHAESYLKENARPDVIVLDVQLPDGNGLEFMESLRLEKATEDIPVIIVSGREPDLGTYGHPLLIDWIMKPFSEKRLLSALETAISMRPSRPARVLVVEDDESTCELIKEKLKMFNNIECFEARDGATAIQLARTMELDLIILDLMMPAPNGFDVVQILRQERSRTTRLIVYTAKDLDKIDKQRLTLGLTAHLTKSRTSEDEFLDTVKSLLNGVLDAQDQTRTSHRSAQT
jgi:PAS domain S-box-containing protein